MKNDGKLICRVPFKGDTIWVILDEPIEETNTVVEPFYPTAMYDGSGELIKLSFETMYTIDETVGYKATPHDISIVYSPGESKQRVIDMLRKFRDDALSNGDYSPKELVDY